MHPHLSVCLLKDKSMKSLAALVNELEAKLPFAGQTNDSVSRVPVGWHIEHSLLALIKMISAVEHSNPAAYKWKFNIKRTIVLTMGKIPRGKARVPDSVKPAAELSISNINGLLTKAKQKAEQFEKLPRDQFFTHPVFGNVRLKQAGRVIAIHTIHHLKIINDILGKK
jgi:hypothetical protein